MQTLPSMIDAQSGPVVVVGHSYGGAVISGAAAGNPNVKALVHVAAFAPEANEPIAAFLEKYPSDLGTAKSSHVPFISHPRTVAKVIAEAANAAR